MELRQHSVTLQNQRIVLRPLTEADWAILLAWNNDPDVLYYAEGDDVNSRSLEEVRSIYRTVSQNAFCFMIERDGQPIGECWLQSLNLERILQAYPHAGCCRIDLMIGKKDLWGRGIGTEVIRLLTAFAFEQEKADFVFACDVADYNVASQKAFRKIGYKLCGMTAQPAGAKAGYCLDFVLSSEDFQQLQARK